MNNFTGRIHKPETLRSASTEQNAWKSLNSRNRPTEGEEAGNQNCEKHRIAG